MDTEYLPKTQTDGKVDLADPLMRDAIRAGHETTDVNVPGLFIFALGTIATVIVLMAGLVVLFWAFRYVNTRLNGRIARVEPGAASRVHLRPDYQGPLLQVKPEEDLRWMRDHNAIDLNGYGWVDQPAGVVRLPVARAMDLLAERGLPPVSPNHTLEELQRMRAQPQVYGQSLRP